MRRVGGHVAIPFGAPMDCLASQSVTHSPPHECNQETLAQLFHDMDQSIAGDRSRCVCLLGWARQRVAAPTLAWNQPLGTA